MKPISTVKSFILDSLPDSIFLRYEYRKRTGEVLHLKHPVTFNEKIQWLKLHDRNPLYSQLVDKYEVKEWVEKKIGSEYIIPTYGVWDSLEEIDLSLLPETFVLKTTHDSGSVVICYDKKTFDWDKAKIRLQESLNRNYYLVAREWPYKNVKHRIIAEELLVDMKYNDVYDYKFFCFGGVARCYKIDFNRFSSHHANYFDMENNFLKVGEEICPPDIHKNIETPANINKLIELAEKLSADIPFLRADFYDINGKIYFGELTFYPAGGFGKFIYKDNDKLLGSWISLPGGGT